MDEKEYKGMETMNRIPLSDRLARLNAGKMSDPTLVMDLIKAVVAMPMRVYLGDFRLDDLAKYLGFGDDISKTGELTYGEVVKKIHEMWSVPEQHNDAVEAMWVLVKPYYIEHKRRKHHGKNQS